MRDLSFDIPVDIRRTLPPRQLLTQVLSRSIHTIERGRELTRAAWNGASVLPDSVARVYRWGPPEALRDARGELPFHWVYVAEDATTAIWEGRFCKNDANFPGRFSIPRAAEDALLASLLLGADLKLFDLGGETAAKLGVYDRLSHPDYRWCQYFGTELHRVLISRFEHTGVIGIRYPSRRIRNSSAIAIHSWYLPCWQQAVRVRLARFGDAPAYRALYADPCNLSFNP